MPSYNAEKRAQHTKRRGRERKIKASKQALELTM
jgi:hypothetical protein